MDVKKGIPAIRELYDEASLASTSHYRLAIGVVQAALWASKAEAYATAMFCLTGEEQWSKAAGDWRNRKTELAADLCEIGGLS